MARAADGSWMFASAATAARTTRGSPRRSSGCSSGTASADAIRPRSSATWHCTNHARRRRATARRDTAGAPNPTMMSVARTWPRWVPAPATSCRARRRPAVRRRRQIDVNDLEALGVEVAEHERRFRASRATSPSGSSASRQAPGAMNFASALASNSASTTLCASAKSPAISRSSASAVMSSRNFRRTLRFALELQEIDDAA